MRLYPQWFVLSGYFIIAHRNYFSIYDLQKPRPQDDVDVDDIAREEMWLKHHMVDESDFIRSLFLEKRVASEQADRVKYQEKSEFRKRFHAQKNFSMYKRYLITAIVGKNKVLRFQLAKNIDESKSDCRVNIMKYPHRLSDDKSDDIVDEISGTILKIRVDLKYRTGTMLIVDSTADQGKSSLKIDTAADKGEDFDMDSCCYFRTNFKDFGRVMLSTRVLEGQYESEMMETHSFYTGVVQRRTMAS